METEADDRRTALIEAAVELFEEKGVPGTKIADVTERVGVARSLFYHYFQNKDDLVNAVVDFRVSDFVGHIELWLGDNTFHSPYDRIAHVVVLGRAYLEEQGSSGKSFDNIESDPLLQQFAVRSALLLADNHAERYKSNKALPYRIGVRHPHESYYLLAIGLVSLLSRRPDIPDKVIVELILDTLHISED